MEITIDQKCVSTMNASEVDGADFHVTHNEITIVYFYVHVSDVKFVSYSVYN